MYAVQLLPPGRLLCMYSSTSAPNASTRRIPDGSTIRVHTKFCSLSFSDNTKLYIVYYAVWIFVHAQYWSCATANHTFCLFFFFQYILQIFVNMYSNYGNESVYTGGQFLHSRFIPSTIADCGTNLTIFLHLHVFDLLQSFFVHLKKLNFPPTGQQSSPASVSVMDLAFVQLWVFHPNSFSFHVRSWFQLLPLNWSL